MSFAKQMKNISVIAMLIAAGALSACGKNEDRNEGGTIVEVPTAQKCMENAYSQQYGQQGHAQPGYGQQGGAYNQPYNQRSHFQSGVYYPYQYNSSSSCSAGMIPACDPNGGGMTCIYSNVIHDQGYKPEFYNWNPQVNNFSYAGYQSDRNTNWQFQYAYSNGAYFPNQVAQICNASSGYNTCGYGHCRPLRQGHSTGICVR